MQQTCGHKYLCHTTDLLVTHFPLQTYKHNYQCYHHKPHTPHMWKYKSVSHTTELSTQLSVSYIANLWTQVSVSDTTVLWMQVSVSDTTDVRISVWYCRPVTTCISIRYRSTGQNLPHLVLPLLLRQRLLGARCISRGGCCRGDLRLDRGGQQRLGYDCLRRGDHMLLLLDLSLHGQQLGLNLWGLVLH